MTLTTSVSAYYNFHDKADRDRSVSMDLATLLTDMKVAVQADVVIKKAHELKKKSIIDEDVSDL